MMIDLKKIHTKLLKKQIDAVNVSNIPEGYKTGLHNLLGTILDDANSMRIKELEKKAWSNITGEEVMNNLSEAEAKEYEELMYGDD